MTRTMVAICGYRVRRGGCIDRALRLAFGLRTRRLLILHTREIGERLAECGPRSSPWVDSGSRQSRWVIELLRAFVWAGGSSGGRWLADAAVVRAGALDATRMRVRAIFWRRRWIRPVLTPSIHSSARDPKLRPSSARSATAGLAFSPAPSQVRISLRSCSSSTIPACRSLGSGACRDRTVRTRSGPRQRRRGSRSCVGRRPQRSSSGGTAPRAPSCPCWPRFSEDRLRGVTSYPVGHALVGHAVGHKCTYLGGS
jgi:hypothetical protein